jgi:hypothetical protein
MIFGLTKHAQADIISRSFVVAAQVSRFASS